MKLEKENLMHCPVCGMPVKLGDKFCGNCGARLTGITTSVISSYARTDIKDNFFRGLLIGVIIGLIIGGLIGITLGSAMAVKTVTETVTKTITAVGLATTCA